MGIVNGLGIRSFSSVKVKVLLRELHRDHHPRFFLHAQGGKYCNLYKANMPGLKYGSCRFGSELLRHRAQKCCALKSSAPFGARQDNYADLLGLQTRRGSNHSAANVGESNYRSNVVQIRRASACVPSRWKVLSGEFRRRPTALAIKVRKSDRVGRRGLSEPREDFSRLPTDAFP